LIKRLFSKLPDLFKLDTQYYMSGGVYLLANYIFVQIIRLITHWSFANYTSKEVYGSYSYLSSIFLVVMLLTYPGISTAVTRSVARGCDGSYLFAIKKRMKFSVLASLALLCAAIIFYYKGQYDLAQSALISVFLYPVAFALEDYLAFYLGRQNYLSYALASSFQGGFSLAGTFVGVVIWGKLWVCILLFLLCRCIANVVLTLIAIRHVKNRELGEGFESFGRNFTLISVVGMLSTQIDKLVIGSFMTMNKMAGYNLAAILTDPIQYMVVIFNQLVFPRMVKKDEKEVTKKFASSLKIYILAIAAGLTVFIFCLPFIFHFFFPKYPESIPIAMWMAVSASIGLLVGYLETYAQSNDKLLKTFWFWKTARPIGIIIITPIMLWGFGLLGAVFTELTIRFIEAVFLLATMIREVRRIRRYEKIAS